MRYLLGIPIVNRADLLRRALESIQPLWQHAIVVDNSESGISSETWPVPILRPPVTLSFTQTMNWLQRLASEKHCQALLFMHNDAEAASGTGEQFVDIVDQAVRTNRNWGVAFTNYDCLAALSTRMVGEVGEWDTQLPQYFADNDYYRRIRLAGFEVIETGLPVVHVDGASNTIKSDVRRLFLNGITFPLYAAYYARKWGGPPGRETYLAPFNGEMP